MDAELSNRTVNSTDPLVEGMTFPLVCGCLPDDNPVRDRPQNLLTNHSSKCIPLETEELLTLTCPIQSQTALQIIASAGLANVFPGTSKGRLQGDPGYETNLIQFTANLINEKEQEHEER